MLQKRLNKCGLCGTTLQYKGGSCQGDETLLQDLVLPQGSTEYEAFIRPRSHAPKWNLACLVCAPENGVVGLHDVEQ